MTQWAGQGRAGAWGFLILDLVFQLLDAHALLQHTLHGDSSPVIAASCCAACSSRMVPGLP